MQTVARYNITGITTSCATPGCIMTAVQHNFCGGCIATGVYRNSLSTTVEPEEKKAFDTSSVNSSSVVAETAQYYLSLMPSSDNVTDVFEPSTTVKP